MKLSVLLMISPALAQSDRKPYIKNSHPLKSLPNSLTTKAPPLYLKSDIIPPKGSVLFQMPSILSKDLFSPIGQAVIASTVAGLTFPLQTLTIAIMNHGLSIRNIPKHIFPFSNKGVLPFLKGYMLFTALRFSQVFFNALGTFYGSSSGKGFAAIIPHLNHHKNTSINKFSKFFLPILGGGSLGMFLSYRKELAFIAESASLSNPSLNSLFFFSVFSRELLLTTALLNSDKIALSSTLGIGAATSIFNSLAILSVTHSFSSDFATRMLLAIPLRMLYLSIATKAQTGFRHYLNQANWPTFMLANDNTR